MVFKELKILQPFKVKDTVYIKIPAYQAEDYPCNAYSIENKKYYVFSPNYDVEEVYLICEETEIEKKKEFKDLEILQPFKAKNLMIINPSKKEITKDSIFIKIPPYYINENTYPTNVYCIDNKNYYVFKGTTKVMPINIICEEL